MADFENCIICGRTLTSIPHKKCISIAVNSDQIRLNHKELSERLGKLELLQMDATPNQNFAAILILKNSITEIGLKIDNRFAKNEKELSELKDDRLTFKQLVGRSLATHQTLINLTNRSLKQEKVLRELGTIQMILMKEKPRDNRKYYLQIKGLLSSLNASKISVKQTNSPNPQVVKTIISEKEDGNISHNRSNPIVEAGLQSNAIPSTDLTEADTPEPYIYTGLIKEIDDELYEKDTPEPEPADSCKDCFEGCKPSYKPINGGFCLINDDGCDGFAEVGDCRGCGSFCGNDEVLTIEHVKENYVPIEKYSKMLLETEQKGIDDSKNQLASQKAYYEKMYVKKSELPTLRCDMCKEITEPSDLACSLCTLTIEEHEDILKHYNQEMAGKLRDYFLKSVDDLDSDIEKAIEDPNYFNEGYPVGAIERVIDKYIEKFIADHLGGSIGKQELDKKEGDDK